MIALGFFWIYILVPAALVSILVLIKLRQARTGRPTGNTIEVPNYEGARVQESKASSERVNRSGEIPENSINSVQGERPQNCPNFLGYLFLKKAPERSHIPPECYNCSKLLQCLYSPNVIEQVYGRE